MLRRWTPRAFPSPADFNHLHYRVINISIRRVQLALTYVSFLSVKPIVTEKTIKLSFLEDIFAIIVTNKLR